MNTVGTAEAVAVENSQTPHVDEGFIFSQKTENSIKNIEQSGEIKDELGCCVMRAVTMKDGNHYDIKTFLPHDRKTNIGVSMTVPWLTEMSGFNTHMALTLAKLGYSVDLISAERNVVLRPNIENSAHNQIAVSQALSEVHDRDIEKMVVTGVSRGAMIGFAVAAQAPQHEIEVVYGDYVAPCYPEAFHLDQTMKHIGLPWSELRTLRHILDLPVRTLRHYPSTFSVRPKSWINHLSTIPNLMSGVAGRSARQMPIDSRGHVTAFKGDIMSQGENWQEIFADFPNMEVDFIQEGAHLSCASPDALRAWKERFKSLVQELD